MSLNLNDVPDSGKKFDRPLAKAGVQPARVAQVIDLGVQARPEFKGKAKSPIRQIMINHELVTDEYEYEGQKVRHRIAVKPLNIISRSSEMYSNSAIAAYLQAIDPKDATKGDLEKLVNLPCLATVVHVNGQGKHAGKVFANITQVSQPPDGFKVPELSTPPVVFDFYNPTAESWASLPQFIQEKIKLAVDYKGSKLEALVKKLETEKA